MSGVTYKTLLEGETELKEVLGSIPDVMQNRVLRFAGRKAAGAVAKQAKINTPKRLLSKRLAGFAGKKAKQGPLKERDANRMEHLADRMTFKQKVYRSSGVTLNIVGAQSDPRPVKKTRLAHLVEFGNWRTRPRKTKHTTFHQTIKTGMITRNHTITRADGSRRTVKELVPRRQRLATGSHHTPGTKPGQQKSRGNMPENILHGIERASKSVDIAGIYNDELKAALERIVARAAKRQ